ncbi:glycoside hydrolase family 65 [Alicyclobacillus sp. SO9]|uniref:glycoside hydrolase family 65 n=1 Tax=Alicyclobacillus sp. SO9 TaxID=2665646 RepID=UPI001E39191B|nr:glycoside hydrolase family 65 [Alicyclobacillus sp. SO9]
MIDRYALVKRHNPVIERFDKYSSLTLGNGEFAMTVDATGLQTFPEVYADGGVPLGTMSNWGWHTGPNVNDYTMENFPLTYLETFNGRKIGFPYSDWLNKKDPHAEWLRNNPHRLHLGMLKFRFLSTDGSAVSHEEITNIHQTLDLWTGSIESHFRVLGQDVFVHTVCHPHVDLIGVHCESDLIRLGQLAIELHFPYGSPFTSGADWNHPESHETRVIQGKSNHPRTDFERVLDEDRYYVSTHMSDGQMKQSNRDCHKFVFLPTQSNSAMEFVCRFSPSPTAADDLPDFATVQNKAEEHWKLFWESGGAVDLSDSTDVRASELERRIVLSQYLTAVNSSGSVPPQESGLIHNSWAGKFHLEMHWWHAVHFALWNRPELLEKSMTWYKRILPQARQVAHKQGYDGVRWPKCVATDGVNAPCYIEHFLIWQQPHPIYYAELLYRTNPTRELLQQYQEIVFESASFMASFAAWDEKRKRYVLGPPLAPAQEIYDHTITMNSPLELTYWEFGLETAQSWRQRLGLPRDKKWDAVLRNLSPLPTYDGVYVGSEVHPDTFTDKVGVKDHPTMVAPLGMLPGENADAETMRKTLQKVLDEWNWDHTWGWDYPMLAMTAARLGEGHLAVDLLLIERGKNRYLPNGHNFQHGGLPVYLPGNGGLLTAVAMMASGWDNGPESSAPGFPQDGTWKIRYEGLSRMP